MSSLTPIFYDVSELVRNPLNTGIQRVVRQLATHWPQETQLIPCKFDHPSNSVVTLASDEAGKLFPNANLKAWRPQSVGISDTVLIPELFFDISRCRFHQERAKAAPFKTMAIVYDFLPWTHPEALHVNSRDMGAFQGYWDFIATRVKSAYISQHVRREYLRLFKGYNASTGPALPLGADSMAFRDAAPTHGAFVVLGSIEDRKNHHHILEAFFSLWSAGSEAKLTFVGKIVNPFSDAAKLLGRAKAHPNFRHVANASDDDVADILSRAHASIFVSELEGYGLPPIESLMAGVPVIVSAHMPSLEGLGTGGQIRLKQITPQTIAAAVSTVLENDRGELAKAIDRPSLPTWQGFARSVHDWIYQGDRAQPGQPIPADG